MNTQRGSGAGCLGCLSLALLGGVAMLFLSVVVMGLVVVGATLYAVGVYLFRPQERPFDAWKMSRWSMWFEEAFSSIYQTTGLDFSLNPASLLIGSVLVTVALLLPLQGVTVLVGLNLGLLLPVLGLGVGFVTATQLARPPQGLFSEQLPGFGLPDGLSAQDLSLLLDSDLLGESIWSDLL